MQVDTFNSRQLLAAGQLEEALKFLSQSVLPGNFRNEIILMNGQWEDSERTFTQNLIDYQQHSRERSRLTMAVLDFLDRMEAEFFEDSARDPNLYFFESGVPMTPKEERQFSDVFPKESTRYIYWEFRLNHPTALGKVEFDLAYEVYNPDKSLMGRKDTRRYIEPGWANSYFANGWGWEVPGKYPPGQYTVTIILNGRKVAEGQFTIK